MLCYVSKIKKLQSSWSCLKIKVGFPPSLTLMAICFANVSLKYGYVCIILDFLPRSTKKKYLFFKYRLADFVLQL